MHKFLITLTCVLLVACGGGGGGGSSVPTAPSVAVVSTITNTNLVYNSTTADLNGDGLEDVVVSGWSRSSTPVAYVYIFIQNADGTLTDKTSDLLDSNVIEGSQRVLVSDFDSDGRMDIFIPGFSEDPNVIVGVHSVMFWGTSGKYTRENWTDVNAAHGACTADFNNDGKMDLLVAGGGFTAQHDVGGIYINNGNRTFTLQPTGLLGANGFSACAVIKDGTNSLVYLTNNTYTAGFHSRIIKIDPTLTVIGETLIADDTYDPIDVIVVDLNNDGKKDFVVAENGSQIGNPGVGPKRIFSNNGNGTFTNSGTLANSLSGFYGKAMVIDGIPSLFVSGNADHAMIYQGTVLYKPTAFTGMAGSIQQKDMATVYQNSRQNKVYMLQLLNNVFKTQEF